MRTGSRSFRIWRKKDGTEIPYFLVKPAKGATDGRMPTLLYGYGGFEVSLTPRYMATFGKLWLERGGAFVIANIRGGGEFGPAWHKAAKTVNRQRAFDDFIAVGRSHQAQSHLAETPRNHGGQQRWIARRGDVHPTTGALQRSGMSGPTSRHAPLYEVVGWRELGRRIW